MKKINTKLQLTPLIPIRQASDYAKASPDKQVKSTARAIALATAGPFERFCKKSIVIFTITLNLFSAAERTASAMDSEKTILSQIKENLKDSDAPVVSLKNPPAAKKEGSKSITEKDFTKEELLSEINAEDFDESLKEAEKIFDKKNFELEDEKKQPKKRDSRKKKEGAVFLSQYLEPWKGRGENDKLSLNFNNADLIYFLDYLKQVFDVTFILDDDIKPPSPNSKLVAGYKINFKSQAPLLKKEIWEIALTFLDMGGFAIVPHSLPRTYRVMLSVSDDNRKPSSNREPLPSFVGVDPSLLPNNDTKVRFVYFVENTEPETLKEVINQMRSTSSSQPIVIAPLRAIMFADKAANIKSTMEIVLELDKSMPEALTIIRLKYADAEKIAKLYQDMVNIQESGPPFMFRPSRKTETTNYFTKNTRVIPEPRMNSLIVLGTKEGIKRFEDFVLKYIDKEVDLPFSPLHIIQLKYLRATEITAILNQVIKFQAGEPAARYGGVRGGEKFFRVGTVITPEPTGNRLIINAPYDDYLKIREVIETMDVEQPQVGIRVMILDVDLTDLRQLGSQIRNSACINPTTNCPNPAGSDCCGPNIFGGNVNFQRSGFSGVSPIVENTSVGLVNGAVTGATRLLGDLISLARGNAAGSTLITLGQDMFGVFGILKILQSYTRTTLIANPFLLATHKYKAEVSIGEVRRLISAIVSGVGGNVNSLTDIEAKLTVTVVPQISYNDEMVSMDIRVDLTQFTDAFGSRIEKSVTTNALLANREVLALGGLIKDNTIENINLLPILGRIPILGPLFFSYKTKSFVRSSLLILIVPEIIKPYSKKEADLFTQSKINDSKELLQDMKHPADRRDPIHRWFFKDNLNPEAAIFDKYLANQQRYLDETKREAERNNHKVSTEKSDKNESLIKLVDEKEKKE